MEKSTIVVVGYVERGQKRRLDQKTPALASLILHFYSQFMYDIVSINGSEVAHVS